MLSYTSVTVIYNPNSTGNGHDLAVELKDSLRGAPLSCSVELIATQHAGHAAEIAYEKAMASKRALVISASGDGGYNELVNGLMRAQCQGAAPVAGLLPAGNANDHFTNIQQSSVAASVGSGKTKRIDLLTLQSVKDSQPFACYGHSYIGLGLTPKVGKQLNQTKLNRINEIFIALRALIVLRPTKIIERGEARSYYSVIAANIPVMSKALKLSEGASVRDGKFELITFASGSKVALLATLLRSATVGLKCERSVANFDFTTTGSTLVQVDGEVHTLDADSETTITIEQAVLECLR